MTSETRRAALAGEQELLTVEQVRRLRENPIGAAKTFTED